MKRRFVMEFERPLAELEDKLEELRKLDVSDNPELAAEIEELAKEVASLQVTLYQSLTPWEKVQVTRHPERPRTDDYLDALFTDVIELHGDRQFRDDPAMFAGFATLSGRKVAVLGHRKGKNTKDNLKHNFGMPHPEGFRKAERVMALAEKAGLPLVTFVDTPGAYPGLEDEERGQAWAIADTIAKLAVLKVPVVAAVVGEGGSGGALAIGFGDRVIMLQNSYYSVITPEACASILHKDVTKACEVAPALHMTADALKDLGIVDEIVPEPLGGAQREPATVISAVGASIEGALAALASTTGDQLAERRYERLRSIGVYSDGQG